jgi:uncharacterized protein YdeI (YjbR/CyaY-like superfamily)
MVLHFTFEAMKRFKSADEYFDSQTNYTDQLEEIRATLINSPLEECVKWGAPAYTYNSKIVIGVGAFKSYVGVWFHQGTLLNDHAQVLMNAQEGKTKALRQWRITENTPFDKQVLLDYIQQSITNINTGNEIKPTTKKPLVIPTLLEELFNTNEGLATAFESLNLTRKREFCDYINEAKRETTKANRLEKIVPMILEGIGLYDKYK